MNSKQQLLQTYDYLKFSLYSPGNSLENMKIKTPALIRITDRIISSGHLPEKKITLAGIPFESNEKESFLQSLQLYIDEEILSIQDDKYVIHEIGKSAALRMAISIFYLAVDNQQIQNFFIIDNGVKWEYITKYFMIQYNDKEPELIRSGDISTQFERNNLNTYNDTDMSFSCPELTRIRNI